MFAGKHQPDRDALSAYLDGELAASRTSELETHVASCAACAEALEGMREVRSMLRAMPEAEAPRSFRLRQADIAAPRRGIPAPPTPLMRAMPLLSAAAVIVFAVTVGFDLAGNGSRGDSESSALLNNFSDGTIASQYAPDERELAEPGAADAATTPSQPDDDGAAARETAPDGVTGSDPSAEAGAAASGGEAGADAPEPADTQLPQASGPAAEETQADRAASSEFDSDDDGNNLVLRIVQVTSAAVALVAAGLAVRTWRKRREIAA